MLQREAHRKSQVVTFLCIIRDTQKHLVPDIFFLMIVRKKLNF